MLIDEQNQVMRSERSPSAPQMVANFVQELWQCCERYNNSAQRSAEYELCSLSGTAGVIRYKNLYCQFDLTGTGNRALQLSIGWYGPGFHLMASPDLCFVMTRGQWRETTNPMLCFDSARDLATFCMNELRHHSESPGSRQPYVSVQTEFTPFH